MRLLETKQNEDRKEHFHNRPHLDKITKEKSQSRYSQGERVRHVKLNRDLTRL